MRVLVLGGTKFVGRAIVERLVAAGHEVAVVHRGLTEPDDLPAVRHLHFDRADLVSQRGRAEVRAFEPEAAVEVYAMNGDAARAALGVLPDGIPLVAISSGDVYRAYDSLHRGIQTDAVPLVETSQLRTGQFVDGSEDANLEVEEEYLARGAAVLRLGMVYGAYDEQRRFEFVLRRLRGGRRRIPIGSGTFLFSKVYADDVGSAALLALTNPAARGEAYNVAERSTAPWWVFAEQILAAAEASRAAGVVGASRAAGVVGASAESAGVELVRVPDDALPEDLEITGAVSQHLQMDASKLRESLGWAESDSVQSLRAAVAWHLAHPPDSWDEDFSADDAALARAVLPTTEREPAG